jgi:hypothetical protein
VRHFLDMKATAFCKGALSVPKISDP